MTNILFFLVALFFTGYLLRYYMTGAGGPTLLAVTLVPVAFILVTLDEVRKGQFYPRLGPVVGRVLAVVYIALCALVSIYLVREFEAVRTVRLGAPNRTDLVIGAIMVVLVMEYTRRRYMPLFWVNLGLILYVVYGWLVPGLFGHPGLTWTRTVGAMSIEMTTGVFSRLPQLALTLIGSFILVLSVLRGFGCVESLIKASTRVAARSPHLLPESAVVGSFGVAAVSGSSAANAATTGSATIPAMVGAGFPRLVAAAVETASSLGGQLMPPIMGISAFIMADFLGVSYFDVVARGFAPALVYFAGVFIAVYLLSARYRRRMATVRVSAEMGPLDLVYILAYVFVVGGLIYLMAVVRMPPLHAALRIFIWVFIGLSVVFIGSTLWGLRRQSLEPRALVVPFARSLESFAVMISDLTLLLASLGILTGAFVITGVPTKIGTVMMEAAGVNLALMMLVAFLFASVVGTGLPPAPTYIITAMVIAPSFIKVGVDPWAVHFFAFFLGVWGELTPPTSVVAAVTSKIAEASYTMTMLRAIGICLPLFVLMGGVMVRPELVTEPGPGQVLPAVLLLAGSVGMIFSINGQYSGNRLLDALLRGLVGLVSLVVAFYPGLRWSLAALAPLVILVVYGFIRSTRLEEGLAPPAPAPRA